MKDDYPVGTRVGAVLSATKTEVQFLGWGTYEGRQVPPIADLETRFTNPKIKLDNGKTVWGYECWWGPEEQIKEFIGNRKVIDANV